MAANHELTAVNSTALQRAETGEEGKKRRRKLKKFKLGQVEKQKSRLLGAEGDWKGNSL